MKYFLAEACRNTFIVFDCLHESSIDETFFRFALACLKKEDRDDALILVDGKDEGDSFSARMLVIGQDGSFGEFCGNGARCCAYYLHDKYSTIRNFFLITPFGVSRLKKCVDDDYAIELPLSRFEMNPKFIADTENFQQKWPHLQYVEVIEPHLIMEGVVTPAQLLELGRTLNQDKELFPHGININAWNVIGKDKIHVMTYERGVQRLTLSCGTGSTACASSYRPTGCVDVVTPGGPLAITMGKRFIELRGPSSYACRNNKQDMQDKDKL